ncbi:MAG: LysR family transcriptional regulator [Bdellovibrionota bacterium]|nr:LysR family transcriptional regulator [Bdellovibrionota bacterium]
MYMQDIDWNLLKSFVFVVKEGSLSAAARALGSTQPTLGRHIESLEENLGASLFVRTREGLVPTEEALALFPEAESMMGSFGSLMRKASGKLPLETGSIRISTSEVIGVELIPELLYKFQKKYPNISIELSISDKMDNLLKREADLAIRMAVPKQEALITKKIGTSPVGLYAHKNYLKKHTVPKRLSDLQAHKIIGADANPSFLAAMASIGISRDRLSFRSDNQIALLQLVRNAAGIGAMQRQLAIKENSLIPILEKEVNFPLPVYLVMHEDLKTSRRIRLMYDFLKIELEAFLIKKG